MINRFLFVIVYTLVIIPIFSQENEKIIWGIAASDEIITSIEITGLKRTKPHIAEAPLEKFLFTERSDFDVNEVITVIKNMGIIEPVSVELIETENGLIMSVAVEEKWSFFPLPIVIADSRGSNYGFFLVDTNAFGMRDNFVLGGMYGTSGWSGMAMYNHIPRTKRMPGWIGMVMYGRNDREDLDKYENTHRIFSTEGLRAGFGINYRFIDLFTGSFFISYSEMSIKEDNEYINPPLNGDFVILEFSPRITLQSTDWDGFLLSQKSISLIYSYKYAIEGSSFYELEYKGILEQSILPGFRFILRSGGIWKSTDDFLYEENPMKSQVSILPRDYSALNYAGLSAGLEKYIYKFNWGTLSAHTSWQGVFSYGEISNLEFDHGPAGGIILYLSRIALPAISFGVAYNVNSKLYQGTFSAGMSF